MLNKKEVAELENAVKEMQLRLHKHYIEELLHKCGAEAGEKVVYLDKTYQILDMDRLMELNRLGNKWVSIYGTLIKKNGEVSTLVHNLNESYIRKLEK